MAVGQCDGRKPQKNKKRKEKSTPAKRPHTVRKGSLTSKERPQAMAKGHRFTQKKARVYPKTNIATA
eukprot:1143706-Pelagomonas_calceolata.AAC.1